MKKPNRLVFSFEPPEDIAAILDAAEKATGADRTKLIIEAIRTDLPKVVQKLIEQQRLAAEEFLRLASEQNRPAVYPVKEERVVSGAEQADAADAPKKKKKAG